MDDAGHLDPRDKLVQSKTFCSQTVNATDINVDLECSDIYIYLGGLCHLPSLSKYWHRYVQNVSAQPEIVGLIDCVNQKQHSR